MIALISGQLAYKSIDHVIVDVNGVGYRLLVPLSTFYALPDEGDVRLHVHTHVREDTLQLFGFLAAEEKEMFGILIGVSGVGPKLAVNILSHIPAKELQFALTSGDVKHLSTLPGIGKKTAERLVLELKDKVDKLYPNISSVQPAGPSGRPMDAFADVTSALVNLGYKEAQARKILEAMEITPGTPMEEVLKGALKILVR